LSRYKVPKTIRFVAALPRNPMGKVLRRELRAQLTAEAET
jgi:long-chain acyl-CoA synthetase